MDDNLVLVKTGQVRDRLAGVLGSARQLQGVRAVEAVAQADLALLLGVRLFKVRLLIIDP